jgi:hypothetical protein
MSLRLNDILKSGDVREAEEMGGLPNKYCGTVMLGPDGRCHYVPLKGVGIMTALINNQQRIDVVKNRLKAKLEAKKGCQKS